MQVSAKQAAILICGICGHSIGPRIKDPGHSKKDLMRCLYTANVGIIQVMRENKWINAEKKYGDLPREVPKSTEQIKDGDKPKGFIYTYDDGTTITSNENGDIIDVKRSNNKEPELKLKSGKKKISEIVIPKRGKKK